MIISYADFLDVFLNEDANFAFNKLYNFYELFITDQFQLKRKKH